MIERSLNYQVILRFLLFVSKKKIMLPVYLILDLEKNFESFYLLNLAMVL